MKLVYVAIGGMLFGFGLALSGMTKQEVVLSFLQLRDLGLLLVMGGAVVVTAAGFRLGPRLFRRPACGAFESVRAVFSRRTVIGAALFGVGWGLSGLCPGSAIASLGTGNFPVLIGIAAMFLGAYVQGRVFPD